MSIAERAKAMEWLARQVEIKVPTMEEVKKEILEYCPREKSDTSDAIEYWKLSLKENETRNTRRTSQ